MRVLVTCATGPVTVEEARTALAGLGWLPSETNSVFVESKTAAVLASLPADVQEELKEVEPILIDVRTGVWGFCSLERQEVLNFRLLGEKVDVLQEVGESIVKAFPGAFAEASGRGEVQFPEPVEIRKRENEDRIAHGTVTRRRTLGFREYVASERGRERRLATALLLLFGLAAAGSLAVYNWLDIGSSEYVRGWFDRFATAFAVALLTTVVNLRFEYADWRREETHIDWHFGNFTPKAVSR